MKEEKLDFRQHHDDEGVDEVRLLLLDPEGGESVPMIRCIMRPRYKTSGLSGDEWRVSACWQARAALLERADHPPEAWLDYDTGYGRLQTAMQAVFPGLVSSHQGWWQLPCASMDFLRKGRPVFRFTHGDDDSVPLLLAMGHLPWSFTILPEKVTEAQVEADNVGPGLYSGEITKDLCFQVGCAEKATTTFRMKHLYSREGDKKPAHFPGREWERYAIRFCQRHVRRGDCGLEDADRNYELVEGPTQSSMVPSDESPSGLATGDGVIPGTPKYGGEEA